MICAAAGFVKLAQDLNGRINIRWASTNVGDLFTLVQKVEVLIQSHVTKFKLAGYWRTASEI